MFKLFAKKTVPPPVEPIRVEASSVTITKDSNIGELAMEYPHLAATLAEDYGLHCIGCFASSFDTLENGAQIHGMTAEEIDEMIIRLNQIHQEFIAKQKKKKD